jgi:putative phage-type endonuclease
MILQGSPEWYAARCGKVTASRVADVVNKIKSGAYSTARANYFNELLCERLTGLPTETYVSKEMQWGKDNEAAAREVYMARTGADVTQVGFVDHPEVERSGASPDGMVFEDGLVEIKCPLTKTHLAFLMTSEIDKDHVTQMRWQMACTGRSWCDYVSYDPRLPKGLDYHCVRVMADPSAALDLETEVMDFLTELAEQETLLRGHCIAEAA